MKIYTKTQQILGDTFTPISMFLALRDQFANVSLFESSDYQSKENSRSYICVKPIVTLQVLGGELEIREQEKVVTQKSISAGDELEKAIAEYHFIDFDLVPHNGFYGVIGYDAIPLFEDIKLKKGEDEIPEIFLAAYQFVIEFDHFYNRLNLVYNSFNPDENELFILINAINRQSSSSNHFQTVGERKSNETNESFKKKISKAKEHVRKGDVFQMVISRQFEQEYIGDDFEFYRQLRTLNPSPYMFYFDLNKAKLIGASPEAQLRITGGKAEIHPIAGTVRRAEDNATTEKRVTELLANEKENAEHMMLVDLARNDLNRTCEDVTVENLKEVQKFSHVIHLVSKVTGKMMNETPLQSFGGSFPAGTLSGAPKYRAMELIDQYEASNRKFYGGAIGLISANGDLNMAIVIRSALSHKNKLIYQAGAGVVLDSTEEGECQEVFNKVASVEQAIQKSNQS